MDIQCLMATSVKQTTRHVHSCQLVEEKSRDKLFTDNFVYTVNSVTCYKSIMH